MSNGKLFYLVQIFMVYRGGKYWYQCYPIIRNRKEVLLECDLKLYKCCSTWNYITNKRHIFQIYVPWGSYSYSWMMFCFINLRNTTTSDCDRLIPLDVSPWPLSCKLWEGCVLYKTSVNDSIGSKVVIGKRLIHLYRHLLCSKVSIWCIM